MVYHARELSLIEYGRNEILGVCRTEHMSPYLISVVVNEPRGSVPETKRIAYLIDLQTTRIMDLAASFTLATVSHDINIDWLVRGCCCCCCCCCCCFRCSCCRQVLGQLACSWVCCRLQLSWQLHGRGAEGGTQLGVSQRLLDGFMDRGGKG
jgi:hypothetical protein